MVCLAAVAQVDRSANHSVGPLPGHMQRALGKLAKRYGQTHSCTGISQAGSTSWCSLHNRPGIAAIGLHLHILARPQAAMEAHLVRVLDGDEFTG